MKTLIYKDIAEIAGLICEEQFLEMLLKMPVLRIMDGSDLEPEIPATQMPMPLLKPIWLRHRSQHMT